MKPHYKITTDSTLVADTQKDIANPATVDVGNLAKFSKGQGLITFWTTPVPSFNYLSIAGYGQGNTIYVGETAILSNSLNNVSYDFTNIAVGTKLKIKYNGNEWCGAYELIFGEVVE